MTVKETICVPGDDKVVLPKWAWGVMAGLASLVMFLLVSFFSWLGITTTHHGQVLESNKIQIININDNVSKIQSKLDVLPSKEVITLPIEINALKEDSKNQEKQLDALERRVDALESGK